MQRWLLIAVPDYNAFQRRKYLLVRQFTIKSCRFPEFFSARYRKWLIREAVGGLGQVWCGEVEGLRLLPCAVIYGAKCVYGCVCFTQMCQWCWNVIFICRCGSMGTQKQGQWLNRRSLPHLSPPSGLLHMHHAMIITHSTTDAADPSCLFLLQAKWHFYFSFELQQQSACVSPQGCRRCCCSRKLKSP